MAENENEQAIALIQTFFGSLGPDQATMFQTIERYLSPEAIWENVGFARTVGIEGAIDLMRNFPGGVTRIDVDMLHIAISGNAVLTERVDHIVDEHRQVSASLRICGAAEVQAGKITALRDYFDTAALMQG